MNQREMQRVTTPSLPRIGEDQKAIITKITDAFKEAFKRDGDKEQRLRVLESERGHGVTRTTVDSLLSPLTALSHVRQHDISAPLDHTSLITPRTIIMGDPVNGLPADTVIRQTAANGVLIGDAANYSEFEPDGTLVFNGDATVWDDMRVVPGSFDRPGVSDPGIVAYDVAGGGVSTYLWEFAKNNIASFTVQLPHAYKIGTDISAHVHWTPGPRGVAENGNTVGWKLDVSWANIDGTFTAMQSIDLSDTCDGVNHKHLKTASVAIDGHTAPKGISSMLICNIKRIDTGADDTWVGTLSGERPMLLEIDFHYQIDTVGSRLVSTK